MILRQYGVIYADPPWAYKSKHTGGSMKSGAVDKYPVLTPDELAALPVQKLAAKDSVMFLWATVPLLPDALTVLKAWGFNYKTAITWHKTGRMGIGYWFRGEIELLLLGIRGKVKAFRSRLPNYVETPVLRHSQKPEVFRDIIEQVTRDRFPTRLELFATDQHEGWDVVGLGVDGRDIRDVLEEAAS